MQTGKVVVIIVLGAVLALSAGCATNQVRELRVQNRQQADLIDGLRGQLDAANLQMKQLQAKLDYAESTGSVDVETLRNQVQALEEDLQRKKDLIARMQQQMLSGAQLPPELSTMLEDFARTNPDMITYDAARGVVKFKSDLLFGKGSDVVASSAASAIKSLSTILNTDTGKEFDVIIAGHTDDIPISRPETRAKHPTNWHLSAHRAIAVLNLMASDGIDNTRMSVRGFGEFRPVVPNAPGKKGSAQNRRVEIFIVPHGM